jgi:hypothetical protein
MIGNAATNPPALPPKTKVWHGWIYKRIARVHPVKRQRIRFYAHAGLAYHGRMHYSQGATRSELFHRKRGDFVNADADCSQYGASCAHWSGVQTVTDADWTGTLGKKGKLLGQPVTGCFVFFGAPPYVHMGVMGRGRNVLGFGSQTGPDRNELDTLLTYFARQGHPGHAFRDITRPS